MAKYKKIIMYIVITIIFVILAVVLILKKGKSNKLINMYEKMLGSSDYTFSMEEENKDEDLKYQVSMAQRGTDICIDMKSDEHTTTLVLDNQAYYIIHDNKEYYIFDEEEIDDEIVMASLNEFVKKEYTTGNEKINGKIYYYEEYDNDQMDFIIFADINEESKIKTRFYFDGDDIMYIKNIIINKDEKEEELINVKLEYSVKDEDFKFPEGYSELEN